MPGADRAAPVAPRRLRACAILLGVLALVLPASARTFRAADNQAADYPTVQALMLMDRLVRERSGGRHTIQVFHSRQLGEERDTIEQTRAGVIDINRVNAAPLRDVVPAVGVLSLPFLFRSEDHLHRVLEGRIGEEILGRFAPERLVGLTFYDSGTRSIYNDVRPIATPADLAGLRIRVQPSDLMSDLLRMSGALPVPLSYGQVLSALQTRLIDGAENNWTSYVTTGHFRRARYITETNHTMPPEILLMSAKAWNELSVEDQDMFRTAARESSRFMRERWREIERRSRAEAAASGIAVVTDVDRKAFEAAARALEDRVVGDPAIRDLRDRIRDTP